MCRPRLAALLAAAGALLAAAQPVPLPNTYDGFKLGSPSAPVLLEGFLDLLCPDCAQAYPTLMQVADHYGPSKLLFNLHIFPLPYHTYAFLGAQGAQVVRNVNGSDAAVFTYAAALFNGAQQSFWNAATANMTAPQVAAAYGALVAGLDVGVSAAAFAAGMADDDLNEDARISWKFGCSRYTTGACVRACVRACERASVRCVRGRRRACVPCVILWPAELRVVLYNTLHRPPLPLLSPPSFLFFLPLPPLPHLPGTPNFLVNGLPVDADPSWTLAQWQALLDPLYAAASGRAARRRAAAGRC